MAKNAREIVEDYIEVLAERLVNDDPAVTSVMAETNASGFELDSYEIKSAEFAGDSKEVVFDVRLSLSGDQDPESPPCGSCIQVMVSGCLENQEGKWQIKAYGTESCSLSDF